MVAIIASSSCSQSVGGLSRSLCVPLCPGSHSTPTRGYVWLFEHMDCKVEIPHIVTHMHNCTCTNTWQDYFGCGLSSEYKGHDFLKFKYILSHRLHFWKPVEYYAKHLWQVMSPVQYIMSMLVFQGQTSAKLACLWHYHPNLLMKRPRKITAMLQYNECDMNVCWIFCA